MPTIPTSRPNPAAPSPSATSSSHPASAPTIAAIATPPGRGAVAIVRASGPGARAILARVFRPRGRAPLRARVARLGSVIDEAGEPVDEALALYFAAPHSYTGEDVIELHVHGSPAIARDVLAAVLAAGARLAQAGEFTRRAFLGGKIDLVQAQAVADLVSAEHRGAARAALANLGGGLGTVIAAIRARLDTLVEQLAAALDFPDEVEPPPRPEIAAAIAEAGARLAALAQTWEFGRLVRDGVGIVLVGAPNAGKSSLLNALLADERALVSDVPGTTRDTIEEMLALGPVAARLVDTAGVRDARDALERAGIARTHAALAGARLALVVIDASRPPTADDEAVLALTRDRERLAFYTKSDLGREAYDARPRELADAMLGSAYDAASIAALRTRLAAAVTRGEAFDLARPHLADARHADAVLAARRSLAHARATLEEGRPVDLLAGDLVAASAALAELTGAEATEALLDRIFARFCIGK